MIRYNTITMNNMFIKTLMNTKCFGRKIFGDFRLFILFLAPIKRGKVICIHGGLGRIHFWPDTGYPANYLCQIYGIRR